jgi:hypothetical protein
MLKGTPTDPATTLILSNDIYGRSLVTRQKGGSWAPASTWTNEFKWLWIGFNIRPSGAAAPVVGIIRESRWSQFGWGRSSSRTLGRDWGAALSLVQRDLHPQIQGLQLDLQMLHVVDIKLVHLLSQSSGSGVGLTPLLLLPVLLGHQATEKQDGSSPLLFLSG